MSYKSFAYDESLKVTPPQPPKEAIAMVEFRPLLTYDGEFGFDWFRVGDNGDRAFQRINSVSRMSISGSITTTELTPIANIQKNYKQFNVYKAQTPINVVDDVYYIPYLSLYTKGRSLTVKNGEKPPFEAELQIKVTIEEELEKVEFEYNERWFSLSFGGLVQDTLPDANLSPCAKRDSSVMKISCHSEKWDGFARNEEIKAWAYPKGKTDKGDRRLVGKIIVLANDKNNRQQEKMIIVPVRTDIEDSGLSSINTGSNPDEEINLRRSLYQSLSFMDVEIYAGELDLSGNADFKIMNSIYGEFIYERGVTPIHPSSNLNDTTDKRLHEDHPDFFSTIRRLFLSDPNNIKYTNYFTVFYFAELTYDSYYRGPKDYGTVLGQVEDIGTKNVCMFRDRNDWTLAHEALHGYGLRHPFDKQSMYYFELGVTDNIMDYGSTQRPFTWAWQWKIVNPKLKL